MPKAAPDAKRRSRRLMLFRQIVNEDLGCASYLVGDADAGIAAVVDPQWDIDPYLRLARVHGVEIAHVLETHTHADHVSGHGRLANATGATIHVHEQAAAQFEHESFGDGWTLALGEVELEAVHAPGHRPEHTAFVLRDRARGDEPWAVLTGDSLFVGDVARPDLAVEPREGAADLFDSLRGRLLSLGGEVEVWPGHLGGSMCGGSALDHKTSSTIGFEREHNPALAISDRDEFVANALASLAEKPPNVERIVALNKGPLVEQLGTPVPLAPREVEAALAEGAIVVDARTFEQFDEAHIPGALSASAHDTGFATKVAKVVPADAELVIVAASDGYELEAAEMLASVALRVRGYLEGGMTAWRSEDRPVARIELIDVDDLASRLRDGDRPLVLDVRDDDEWERGHIPGSIHIPYGELPDRLGELPRERAIAAICSGGKRSGLGASVLQREGFDSVAHVTGGGVGTWERQGLPIEKG